MSYTIRKRLGRIRWLVQGLTVSELMSAMKIAAESAESRSRRLDRAVQGFTGRLIFVCYGNIMRSAFATEYVRGFYPEIASRVCGAGTHAKSGRPAQSSALAVAPALGVDLAAHRATALSDAAPKAGDIVICMDLANAARAALVEGADPSSVFLIGDSKGERGHAREVEDPYAKGDAATHQAFARIREYCDEWMRKITHL